MDTPDERTRAEGDGSTCIRRLTRRGFAMGGAMTLMGLASWRWLVTRSEEGGLPWPFRRVLRFNESLARAGFRSSSLAPEFPPAAAGTPRVNGLIGIDAAIDPASWRLRVVGASGEAGARLLRLEEIKALPRVEMTNELKCIEGWSVVVHWAGARLADLAALTGLASRDGAGDLLSYASLATPDAAYYVGLDIQRSPSADPALLRDDRPFDPDHGRLLRLVIPTAGSRT